MFSDSCANLLFGAIFLLIVCEDSSCLLLSFEKVTGNIQVSKLEIYEVTSAVDIMLVLA